MLATKRPAAPAAIGSATSFASAPAATVRYSNSTSRTAPCPFTSASTRNGRPGETTAGASPMMITGGSTGE